MPPAKSFLFLSMINMTAESCRLQINNIVRQALCEQEYNTWSDDKIEYVCGMAQVDRSILDSISMTDNDDDCSSGLLYSSFIRLADILGFSGNPFAFDEGHDQTREITRKVRDYLAEVKVGEAGCSAESHGHEEEHSVQHDKLSLTPGVKVFVLTEAQHEYDYYISGNDNIVV